MATVLAETRGRRRASPASNRPDARNALSPELMEELAAAARALGRRPRGALHRDRGQRRVVRRRRRHQGDGRPRPSRTRSSRPRRAFWPRLAAIRTPLIAAVSGYALGGGCELALACDMIVASETAEFGQPEILLGIIPGGGGTQRLARVIGKQRAMELVLTGRRIDAREAHEIGLVNQVAPAKEWLDDALELAAVVARRPPIAGAARRSRPCSRPRRPRSAPGSTHERRLYELAMATEDRVEGMTRLPREAQAGVPRPVSAVPEALGVVGAGTMGAGIAQLGCAAGMRDAAARPAAGGARARAASACARGLDQLGREGRGVRRRTRPGRLEPAGDARRARRLRARDRGRARAARAQARAVRARCRRSAADDAVLATNTSSIPVTVAGRRRGAARERGRACTSSTRRR